MSARTFHAGDRAVVSDRDQGEWRTINGLLPVGTRGTISTGRVDRDGDIAMYVPGLHGDRLIDATALDPLPDPADEVIVRASDLPEVTWDGRRWLDSDGCAWVSAGTDLGVDLESATTWLAAVRAERARRAAEKPSPDPAQVEALAALIRDAHGARIGNLATALLATGKVTVEVEP
jgi:hypothetical protein